jgi:hypothetical protein
MVDAFPIQIDVDCRQCHGLLALSVAYFLYARRDPRLRNWRDLINKLYAKPLLLPKSCRRLETNGRYNRICARRHPHDPRSAPSAQGCDRETVTEHRFHPWSVEDRAAAFAVCDANGQALAYVYFEDESGRHAAARLPELLKRK